MTIDMVQFTPGMPVMTLEQAKARTNDVAGFCQDVLHREIDFSEIGGGKPTLLLPGAEKLATFFGLTPHMEILTQVLDWTGADHGGEPFVMFLIRCHLFDVRGVEVANMDALCHSQEEHYRWSWVMADDLPEGTDVSLLQSRGAVLSEFAFAVTKAETTGKYGKPPEYWKRFQDAIENGTARKTVRKTKDGKDLAAFEIDDFKYQIPNPRLMDYVHTILRQAEKRAFVAAVKTATGTSAYFTQDLDSLEILDTTYQVHGVNFGVGGEKLGEGEPGDPTDKQKDGKKSPAGATGKNTVRPYPPDVVRSKLLERIAAAQLKDNSACVPEKRLALTGWLDQAFRDTTGGYRVAFLRYLGIESTKDLTSASADTISSWLLTTGPDGSKALNPFSQQEVDNIAPLLDLPSDDSPIADFNEN